MKTAATVLAGVVLLLLTVAWQRNAGPLPGFTAASSADEWRHEGRFIGQVSADRIRDAHALLTSRPHMAGTPRDRELALWTRDRFVEYGLQSVEIVTHEVLLPWPVETTVEMVQPRAWRASMREEPIAGDPATGISLEEAGIPYHAYSASGEVTAPVVYAGSGNPSDYDGLAKQGIDIKGRIALVRYSVPYSYRGFKALTAEQRGAAGILIYSDPEDDGAGKGEVYPDGPWGPESHIQRGGIVYDFLVPGDPLTPGWASLPGARRIDRKEAVSLPKIVSAPLSYKDAKVLLEALGVGAHRRAPQDPSRLPVVRMRVRSDDAVRPIWTVTGMIRGVEDEVVIVGNHRDAWVYGGVDPSSGSAAMMELARGLGALAQQGWRPKRSILFASWDAEEFTLTSSTEWGEQRAGWLERRAVAYLNVDSAASGPSFGATAVPSLNELIAGVADAVDYPGSRVSVGVAMRDRKANERGALPSSGSAALVDNRLGSGSDYTVFLNHLGIPVVDMTFDGPYGVYHSIYDNHQWVSRIGDPGFQYHAALVRIWGLLAMRLAGAEVLPFEYGVYAERLREFATEVERRHPVVAAEAFQALRRAIDDLRAAASELAERRTKALQSNDASVMRELNARLLGAERLLIGAEGIPGRPWYRHLVYAPKYTYAPEVLPGIAAAQESGDAAAIEREVTRVTAAVARLAARLR